MKRLLAPLVLALLCTAVPAASAAPPRDRPPLPRITSAEDSVFAMRGSYCWFYEAGDGTGQGICADYARFPRPNPRRLDAAPGEVVVIDMNHAVRHLGSSRRGMHRVRGSDHRFRFRVPTGAERSFDLYLGADYGKSGDGSFAFRVVVR